MAHDRVPSLGVWVGLAAALVEVLPGASEVWCEVAGEPSRWPEGARAGNPKHRLVEVEVRVGGLRRGHLAARLPARAARQAEQVLTGAAQVVALQLSRGEGVPDVLTVAEAVGGLVHAVNNHLNSVVLRAACLQMRLEGEARLEAEAIRREGAAAAALLRPVQEFQPWAPAEGAVADLVAAVRAVLTRWPALAAGTDAELPPGAVLVSGSAAGLERIIWLLLRIGQRCAADRLCLRVEAGEEEATLLLDLPGPRAEDGEGWQRLPPESEPGLGELEREAVRWMLRQQGAHVEVEPTADGLRLRVSWTSDRARSPEARG